MNLETYEWLINNSDIETLAKHTVAARNAEVGDIVICRGYYSLVLAIKEWPANQNDLRYSHPEGCPIQPNITAIEVITTNGSRWHGKS